MKLLLIGALLAGSTSLLASDCSFNFKSLGTKKETVEKIAIEKGYKIVGLDSFSRFTLYSSVYFGPLGEIKKRIVLDENHDNNQITSTSHILTTNLGSGMKAALLAAEASFLSSLPECK